MTSPQRMLAFFSAMLITFGLSDLNFSDTAFSSNATAYYAMILGSILFIAFLVTRYKP